MATAAPSVAGVDGLLAPGTVLADRYRIEKLLGQGGMGAVYLAEHVHMRKHFAVKVLHKDMCENPEVVSRFEREAVAAGAITHPNVAAATDFGRLASGAFFLVLEYVPGKSLREVIDLGPLDAERAKKIAIEILGAVGAAHAKGIIHRDLKPENVMLLEREGDPEFVKVLDFGIAKVEASRAPGQILTQMGAIFGTPDYMAPEQALGETVDARADVYSVGVILYEMLAGTRPFQGGAVTILTQRIVKDAPPLPDALIATLDPALVATVQKLLAKLPVDRYASAAEASSALEALGRVSLVVSPPPSTRLEPGGVLVTGASPAPAALMPTIVAQGADTAGGARAWRMPTLTPLRVVASAGVLAVLGTIAFVFSFHGAAASHASPAPMVSIAGGAPADKNASTGTPRAKQGVELTVNERRAGVTDPSDPSSGARQGAGAGGGRSNSGGGGFHIPPPSQWFR